MQFIPLTKYFSKEDYHPKSEDCISLSKDDIVEILDKSKSDIWLVRTSDERVGFVEPIILQICSEKTKYYF